MKVLLTTLNAKFVHIALPLWYLYHYARVNYCPGNPALEFKLREFNINQDLGWICGEMFGEQADVIGFSCNIWNIEQILIICQRIKWLAPKTVIILGGPEVSAEPEELLSRHPAVDFIVVGEGEITFTEWLQEFGKESPEWSGVDGLVYRDAGRIVANHSRAPIDDLSILPFPYPEDLAPFRHKLVYHETSRGCPFHCQYCLSANEQRVRFLPMERVQQELLRFIDAEIAQVKFVDRSFNCNPDRAKLLWRFLIEHPGRTNFHFEIVGDLLDDESIEILAQAPPGMFQFEIGVQSTNSMTLELIQRKMDFTKLSHQVSKLVKKQNIFIHLDLIAGLPGEDYPSFARTFDENMAIKPDRLQLGFLKLLKGSGVRERAAEYGYIFTAETPYEVMANHWITYGELLQLKVIEDLLERYHSSRRFARSMEYLFAEFPSPFMFFESLARWWKTKGYDQCSHKEKDLYAYLLQFYQTVKQDPGVVLRNLLKYDLLTWERMVELPEWSKTNNLDLKSFGYQFWLQPGNIDRYIPESKGLTVREIQRRVLFAEFDFNPMEMPIESPNHPVFQPQILLFVYGGKKARAVKIKPSSVHF
jgi:radical SAM superfamily enzyme YgiQ (UPF0313 family)